MREYKEIYNNKQYKRCSRVTKEKLESLAWGLEGKGSGRSAMIILPLRISNQQPGESVSSKLEDLDMQIQESQKLSNKWCDECQVACRDKHICIDKSKSKECVENMS